MSKYVCRYAHVRSNRNSSSHNEVNLATVLICIVIMFLLCHFPRLIINVAEFIINRTFRCAVAYNINKGVEIIYL